MDNKNKERRQSLITSGLSNAYEYTLEKLYEASFPIDNYFELCANYVLEYERLHICPNQKSKPGKTYSNEDNRKGVEVKVNISSYEQMLPIWVYKGHKITITVKNLSLSSFQLTTENKSNIYYQREYPNGLLLARVGNSEEEGNKGKLNQRTIPLYHYFILSENNTQEYISPYTGPLFIVYNTEQSIILPQSYHSMTIIVKHAQFQQNEEIYQSLGLKNYHSQTEQGKRDHLIQIINFLRSNPSLFANLFLKHITRSNKAVKDLYDFLVNLKPIPLLNYSNYIYQHLQMKTWTVVKSNPSSQALSISNIKPSLINTIGGLEECITLIKYDIIPLQIIISLLIDEDFPTIKRNRDILLNPLLIYYASSISLIPSTSSDYICLQEFCSNDTQMFS